MGLLSRTTTVNTTVAIVLAKDALGSPGTDVNVLESLADTELARFRAANVLLQVTGLGVETKDTKVTSASESRFRSVALDTRLFVIGASHVQAVLAVVDTEGILTKDQV